MAKVNITRDLIRRQIKERGALSFERRYHVTDPFIRRLGLEAELQGHSGCVNCLEWNEKGDLLASGSDDQHTIVWDPLHHKKLLSMHTGHTANIFSVKVSRIRPRASKRHDWAVHMVVFAHLCPTYPLGSQTPL